MKIKKHGKKYDKITVKTEDFTCSSCGCEFSAKEDEYYTVTGLSAISVSAYTYTCNGTLVCSCPECHKIVTKTKTQYNPCISVTGTNAASTDSVTITCDSLTTCTL